MLIFSNECKHHEGKSQSLWFLKNTVSLASSVALGFCSAMVSATSFLTSFSSGDSSYPCPDFVHLLNQTALSTLLFTWGKPFTLMSIKSLHLQPEKICVLSRFSHVQLFTTQRTITCQAPLSIRFFRQKYWSGLPCPPPGNLPKPAIEPMSLMSPVLAGVLFTTNANWEAPFTY